MDVPISSFLFGCVCVSVCVVQYMSKFALAYRTRYKRGNTVTTDLGEHTAILNDR